MVTVSKITSWSDPEPLIPGAIVTSNKKPAMCDYNGKAFLAWPTSSISSPGDAGPTFSFTHWVSDRDGWASPKLVQLGTSDMYQSHTSALVVFRNNLYAFVPYRSTGDGKGCRVFRYDDDEATFVLAGNWSEEWNGDLAAVVDDNGLLHVFCVSDAMRVWKYSDSRSMAVPRPLDFSASFQVPTIAITSIPALTVRDGKVRLYLLSINFLGRSVLEYSLDMSNKKWNHDRTLQESGNSGISAMTSPDGKYSWICFKKHDGSSSLLCKYDTDSKSWSPNYNFGNSETKLCWYGAALAWSDNYAYLVWNSHLQDSALYYSRTFLKPATMGTGYNPDQPSPTDAVVNMSAMAMDQVANIKYWNISNPRWVINQGAAGSCTANAVATAYRYELRRQNKEDFMTSRLYLYYVGRLGRLKQKGDGNLSTPAFYNGLANSRPSEEMTIDDGCNIREAIRVISSLGAIAEASWGYEYTFATNPATTVTGDKLFVQNCNASFPPNNVSFATAKKHFVVKYALAKIDSPNCWKMCIHMGYPIMFAFNIYTEVDKFLRSTELRTDEEAIAPVPDLSKEKLAGSHAVLAVGWDDSMGLGCFLVQNSWGTGFGKGGFFWMPYQWLSMKDIINPSLGGFTLMNSYDS